MLSNNLVKARRLPTWAIVSFSTLFFILVMQAGEDLRFDTESLDYLKFADEIRLGTLFDYKVASSSTASLTPAYPFFLAVAKAVAGSNQLAVMILHALLGVAALLVFVFRFKRRVSAPVACFLCLLAFYLWHDTYFTVLPDWSLLCVLVLFFATLPLKAHEFTKQRFLALGAIVSVLVLLLSSLLVAGLIPTLALFIVPRGERRPFVAYLLIGLFPIFLWSVFNLYRLGDFCLSASGAAGLFAMSSVIGSADFDATIWPDAAAFAEYVNTRKKPEKGKEETSLKRLGEKYPSLPYQYNIDQVAFRFEQENGLPRAYTGVLMEKYARAVILKYPLRYLRLVTQGLSALLRDAWLLLISGIVTVLLVKNSNPLGIPLGAALALHLSFIVWNACIGPISNATYLLTLTPLGLVTTMCLVSAIQPQHSTWKDTA